ncbi:YbaB/EbfC family nucleoid-associated protein [Mycoplasma phocimorsus]|uniref:Nucleoid-associated protein QLQ80_02020 n=1 Tax=Mycoplasma phocimorsus TaxID=3045839 RepID=A0AAJ1PSE1_9MOLU|nr:YbaB/EbfC family nucleoid-associated protein [Mycoplasma phocimorsus]MDJ1645863.1 YbaB/EbfC family nucleoid-associated protein [Mycoplasma phocimorsus]MDJ1646411.1 YbaB/EbfC family nucleoid-associated protein [Mycoplasma phocimorsus]MDJ1647030.1 YbaB/EbfC family nucleoid-associated protein [Mycoplasma phocimorsus]MDJ1647471.1 YbaB/EbfC family nucleoid-associated protein [Mycoplasma phocimorsus]MDJ1647991.1 YbaB/EbfC family nucleoid-associated protein [Mycoplasma phocimorsus]
MNINELMKQARKMQAEMELKEKEFHKKEFSVEKQGLSLVITGDKKIKSIKINPVLIDEDDIELLEDVIKLTINDTLNKIDEELEASQPKMPGNMPF